MYATICTTCKSSIDGREQRVTICTCTSVHHFQCLADFVSEKGDTDYFVCTNCSETIKVPTVYYAHKIKDASRPAFIVDNDELVKHRELRYPFHYRVGHWACVDKHEGVEDDAPGRSFAQIKAADYVYADLRDDAHGTIAEVGIAVALGKPVFLKNGDPIPVEGTDGSVFIQPSWWFARDLALMSQQNFGSDLSKTSYKTWLKNRNKLPREMRELKKYEDNGGIADGHFLLR